MIVSALEHQQPAIAESVTVRLVARRSSIFCHLGAPSSRMWVDRLLTALLEDSRGGSHEAVRSVVQHMIHGLGSEGLTFGDLRYLLITLRERLHDVCADDPAASRVVDDALFELSLVAALRFMVWRESTLQQQSVDTELARLGSQLAALQAALADKARLVDEVSQLNTELRRQLARHSNRLMDMLVAGSRELRGRSTPTPALPDCYVLVRKIGEGGMGTVYEVERTSDHVHLAAKVINHGSELRRLRRFIREAQILAQVVHPNLIAIHDVDFDDDGVLYIVMELAAGSLRECVSHVGDVPWCLAVFVQVCEALVLLHARAIVHRDLKPENILVMSADGRPYVKVADFGIAIALEDSGEGEGVDQAGLDEVSEASGANLGVDENRETALDDSRDQMSRFTGTGVLLGTPLYMAPELARGSRWAVPASDVFSFGVIACECLLGEQPFAHPAVYSAPVDLTALADVLHGCAGLPGEIAAMILRCLDWDPARRPSAPELVEMLAGAGAWAGV